MNREHLESASDHLDDAASITDDSAASDRLGDLAGQLETLADRSQGPDHGRLARIENALDELRDDLEPAAISELDAAHNDIVAFRKTVEGV